MDQVGCVKRVHAVLALTVCLASGVGVVGAAGQQPPAQAPPAFRSSVEVTSLDVTVVDDRGKPLTDLAPADFAVRIDGNPRKVVSAKWVPLATPPAGKEA